MAGTARLTLDGRAVRYREEGSGPPVVLVHGLGLSSGFWARHYPIFAANGLRAVAPDLPGFGGSSGGSGGLSVSETAEWLLRFADALELDRAAWLGHSIAAQPVLELAARHPDRATALILASPTGAPVRFSRLRQVGGLVRDIGREPFALVPAVLREYVKASPTAYVGTWLKAARHRPLDRAPAVRCPTLILVGHHDPLVPPGYIRRLRTTLPRARVAHIADGAHGVAFGQADAFDRAVVAFLHRHAGGV